MRRISLRAVAGLAFALGTGGALEAQTSNSLFRTRQWLDSVATATERSAATAKGERREELLAEAKALRERLTVGDFYPGDRFVLELYGGEEPYRDTVAVRAGQELLVGRYPAFSLKGVLRSELDSALTVQARRYLTQPVVRTTPLVRLLVTGAVPRPGFHTIRGDASVTDVVTLAGGLAPNAMLRKSELRRANERVADADSIAVVLQTGMTIDQADLRAGDELRIGEKKQTNYMSWLWGVSLLIGTITTITALLN